MITIESLDKRFHEVSEQIYGSEWIHKADSVIEALSEHGFPNATGILLNVIFAWLDNDELTKEAALRLLDEEQYEDLMALHEAVKKVREKTYNELVSLVPAGHCGSWDEEKKLQIVDSKYEGMYGNISMEDIKRYLLVCDVLNIDYEIRLAYDMAETLMPDCVEICYIREEMDGPKKKGHYLFECMDAVHREMIKRLEAKGSNLKNIKSYEVCYGHECELFPELTEPLLTEEEAIEIIRATANVPKEEFSINMAEHKVVMNEAKRQSCLKHGLKFSLMGINVDLPRERFMEAPDDKYMENHEEMLVYIF